MLHFSNGALTLQIYGDLLNAVWLQQWTFLQWAHFWTAAVMGFVFKSTRIVNKQMFMLTTHCSKILITIFPLLVACQSGLETKIIPFGWNCPNVPPGYCNSIMLKTLLRSKVLWSWWLFFGFVCPWPIARWRRLLKMSNQPQGDGVEEVDEFCLTRHFVLWAARSY